MTWAELDEDEWGAGQCMDLGALDGARELLEQDACTTEEGAEGDRQIDDVSGDFHEDVIEVSRLDDVYALLEDNQAGGAEHIDDGIADVQEDAVDMSRFDEAMALLERGDEVPDDGIDDFQEDAVDTSRLDEARVLLDRDDEVPSGLDVKQVDGGSEIAAEQRSVLAVEATDVLFPDPAVEPDVEGNLGPVDSGVEEIVDEQKRKQEMAEAIANAFEFVTDAVTGQTTEIPFDLANSGEMPPPAGGIAMAGVLFAVGSKVLCDTIGEIISDKGKDPE